MWSALTNRLPTNTAKLLALCIVPSLFQVYASAIGSTSIHINPESTNTAEVLEDIRKESPEITYMRIPENYDDRENIVRFIQTLYLDKHTVAIADTHHSSMWDHLALNERMCK